MKVIVSACLLGDEPDNRMQNFSVLVASEQHIPYISDILSAIEIASKVPGNSIVLRDPTYLTTKMREGFARRIKILMTTNDNDSSVNRPHTHLDKVVYKQKIKNNEKTS